MKGITFVLFYIALALQGFSQNASNSYLASTSEMAFPALMVKKCFGLTQGDIAETKIEIIQIKQGYGYYELGKSINKETVTIGSQKYMHGIGTHANSELLVRLPVKAKRFKAFVGYDGGLLAKFNAKNGIVFSVISNGKVLWKSAPLSVESAPVAVDVPLNGLSEFILKVESINEDFNWTHANWADPSVELEKGKIVMLDKEAPGFVNGFPFSFTLNGESSRVFLPGWKKSSKDSIAVGKVIHTIKWSKPDGTFEVKCQAIEFKNHPAMEWNCFSKIQEHRIVLC